MGQIKKQADLHQLAAYARKYGYRVEIMADHIVASNEYGTVRTASMETIKRVCGGAR